MIRKDLNQLESITAHFLKKTDNGDTHESADNDDNKDDNDDDNHNNVLTMLEQHT